MDPNSANLKCDNCGEVTLADGRKVWVCEHCGNENQPQTLPVDMTMSDMNMDMSAPASPATAPSPVPPPRLISPPPPPRSIPTTNSAPLLNRSSRAFLTRLAS